MNKFLNGICTFAFDLDGTIYQGQNLVDRADWVVEKILAAGNRVIYFTNNSGQSRRQIVKKLIGLGIPASVEEVINSAYAAAVWLSNNKFRKIFCIGTYGLKDELLGHGVKCVGAGENPEAILVGLDPAFNYATLAELFNIRRLSGCPIIACNRDPNYPVENNGFLPGCGALVAAVETALRKPASMVIGKPNTYMLMLLQLSLGIRKRELLVVGDSFESDMQMALNFGVKGILVNAKKRRVPAALRCVPHTSSILRFFDDNV